MWPDKNPLLEQPTGKPSMAPGFFTPSKTNSSSAFQLTLPLVPLYNPRHSSPTVSFINRDTNSQFSILCSAFTPHLHVRYGSRNTKLCIIYMYLSVPLLLCFPYFSPISWKFRSLGQSPDKIFELWAVEQYPFSQFVFWSTPRSWFCIFLGGLVGESPNWVSYVDLRLNGDWNDSG